MTNSTRPPGPDIASTNASPGMIDVNSARRPSGRTAGWALSRIAHASELAGRHMALFCDIAGALPIVRVRTDAGTEEDARASDAADAPPLARKATDAPVAEGQVNSLDNSLGEPIALATRLQRRAAGAGVVRPWMPWSTARQPAGPSLRPGLHDRLAARAATSSEAMQAPGQTDRGRANGGSLQWRAATAARATGHGETSDRPSMPVVVAASGHAAAVSEVPRSMPSVATLARRIMSDGATPQGLPSPSPTTAVVPSPSGMSAGGALSLAWGPAGKLSGCGEGAAAKASELLRPTSDPSAIASPLAHIGPPALSASVAQRDAVERSIAARAEMPSRQDDGSATRVDRQTDDPRRDALAPVSLACTPSAAGAMRQRLARRVPGAQPMSDLVPGAAVHRHRQANGPVREAWPPAVTVTRPTLAASCPGGRSRGWAAAARHHDARCSVVAHRVAARRDIDTAPRGPRGGGGAARRRHRRIGWRQGGWDFVVRRRGGATPYCDCTSGAGGCRHADLQDGRASGLLEPAAPRGAQAQFWRCAGRLGRAGRKRRGDIRSRRARLGARQRSLARCRRA